MEGGTKEYKNNVELTTRVALSYVVLHGGPPIVALKVRSPDVHSGLWVLNEGISKVVEDPTAAEAAQQLFKKAAHSTAQYCGQRSSSGRPAAHRIMAVR